MPENKSEFPEDYVDVPPFGMILATSLGELFTPHWLFAHLFDESGRVI